MKSTAVISTALVLASRTLAHDPLTLDKVEADIKEEL